MIHVRFSQIARSELTHIVSDVRALSDEIEITPSNTDDSEIIRLDLKMDPHIWRDRLVQNGIGQIAAIYGCAAQVF